MAVVSSERRDRAVELAKRTATALRELGVEVKIIGSLAKGSFGEHSDIDFVVMFCPEELKYRIEGLVEDCLMGFKFDVVYFDEIPPHRLERFMEGAIDASDLC